MKYNTRFNPTVNGYLHLGHLYNALVNYWAARDSGGTFGIRFDDDQRYWRWKCGDQIEHYKGQMLADLAHFGINPDYVHSQMDMSLQVSVLVEEYLWHDIPDQAFSPNRGVAEVVGMDNAFYPLVPSITAEKVAFDFIDEVNWLIRGIDLITEDCLYRYFCDQYQIQIPRMTYIPRLQFAGDEVSKTKGNFKLKEFKNIPANDVLINLAFDCLLIPEAGWRVDNLRHPLVLGGWAYAVHS